MYDILHLTPANAEECLNIVVGCGIFLLNDALYRINISVSDCCCCAMFMNVVIELDRPLIEFSVPTIYGAGGRY